MKIVIAGAGEVGSHLAKMLSSGSNEITVIDTHTERLNYLSYLTDIIAVEGVPSSVDVLRKAGVAEADLFIAVYPSESQDVNIVSAILAKQLGAKKVTARINNEEDFKPENKIIFTEMGIDKLFYPEKDASKEIIDRLTHTAAADSMDFAKGKLQMEAFKIDEDSPIIDMSIKELAQSTMSREQFRVIAITRGNETIIPNVDSRFKCNDRIFIISTREGIEALMPVVGKNDTPVRNVMIMGGSHIAEMVAKELLKKKEPIKIKIIEKDKARCSALAEILPDKVMIINGDGRDSNLLVEESISSFDAFIALTGSSETNILACVAAKKNGVVKTIAQVENIEYISLADGMGVDAVVNKKLTTAGLIFKFTLSDKAKFVRYMSGRTNAEIVEFIVDKDSRITKAPLKSIDFPKDAIIGGIIRGTESFIAVGDTQIKPFDKVVVFALPNSVKEVDEWFKTKKSGNQQNQ